MSAAQRDAGEYTGDGKRACVFFVLTTENQLHVLPWAPTESHRDVMEANANQTTVIKASSRKASAVDAEERVGWE